MAAVEGRTLKDGIFFPSSLTLRALALQSEFSQGVRLGPRIRLCSQFEAGKAQACESEIPGAPAHALCRFWLHALRRCA